MNNKKKPSAMEHAAIEQMQKKLDAIDKNVTHLCEMLEDDWEITPRIRKQLEKARKAPRSDYTSHEELKKQLFG